mgnify:CR=1 FL=1
MHILDSEHLRIGSSNDIDIYHTSDLSYITNSTGRLYIKNTAVNLIRNLKFNMPFDAI